MPKWEALWIESDSRLEAKASQAGVMIPKYMK